MTLDEHLAIYEAAHRHPVNKATHAVGIPLIVASLGVVFFNLWWGLGMFVVGWIFQFIGHAAEGNSPKFFQGPIYLLIGPVWVVLALLSVSGLYRRKKPEALAPGEGTSEV